MVGWVSRPCAESDTSIVDCYLAAAGDTGRDDPDVAALQQWRRRYDVMWVSELLRAEGRTPKHRFGDDLQRRVGTAKTMRCDSAQSLLVVGSSLRLCSREWAECSVRHGTVCGKAIPSGTLACCVQCANCTTVVLTTYDSSDGNVVNRDTQHCFVADGNGEISYDAQLIMVGNVREADDGKVYVAGDELLEVRAAESATASDGEAAATPQADRPCKTYISNTGITDHNCVTSAHETLPWGVALPQPRDGVGTCLGGLCTGTRPPGAGGRDSCSGSGGSSRPLRQRWHR